MLRNLLSLALTMVLSVAALCGQTPKNIIYLIGDGMSIASVSMMQLVNKYEPTIFDRAENVALQKSYSADNRVTDSAASGTALATGVKTNNTYLGVLPDGTVVESLMEVAQRQGMATGVIVTTYLQHATPAAFYAHVPSRHEYAIISEQIQAAVQVDLLPDIQLILRLCHVIQQEFQDNRASQAPSLDLELGKTVRHINLPDLFGSDETRIFHRVRKPVSPVRVR